ncbi:hypothetical protein BC827DRAFT_554751 [Russula dissimulans]|nr:hypothetical protein BC827DRAFT_554751 [Russula dissimulans]
MNKLWRFSSTSPNLSTRIQSPPRQPQMPWMRSFGPPILRRQAWMTQRCHRPSALVISHQRLRHTQSARIYSESISTLRHSKTPLLRISLRVRLRIPAQSPRLIRTTPIRAAQVLLRRFLTQRQRTLMSYFVRQSGRKLQVETRCSTKLKDGDGTARWRPQIKHGLSLLHRQGGIGPRLPDTPVLYLSITCFSFLLSPSSLFPFPSCLYRLFNYRMTDPPPLWI